LDARRETYSRNKFCAGIPVKAIYLPFAYLALTVFMGNAYADMCHGLAIGHLYYFLVDVVPQVQGKDLLVTPQFLIDYFGIGEYRADEPTMARVPAAGRNDNAEPARGGGGYGWGGAGQRLGRE
jgi:Derlin-2/3